MNQHYVYSRDTKLYIIIKNLNSGEQSTSWEAACGKSVRKIFTLYGTRQLLLGSYQSANGSGASELNSVHILRAQMRRKHFNIIIRPPLVLDTGPYLSSYPNEILHEIFISPIHPTSPVSFITIEMNTLIIFSKQYICSTRHNVL
jgi:hypothetical protein